ncbi:MAG: DEAD/DEAH box helicase [Selenomonadaceae bacterium]|nr:DEAD/DEAH box helicase [Selenomonadaceae bacterium]
MFVTAPTGAGKSLIFQIPAIYLAERFKLLTIVVSPLIALMNDHVINLGLKNFDGVETINSETPPNNRACRH